MARKLGSKNKPKAEADEAKDKATEVEDKKADEDNDAENADDSEAGPVDDTLPEDDDSEDEDDNADELGDEDDDESEEDETPKHSKNKKQATAKKPANELEELKLQLAAVQKQLKAVTKVSQNTQREVNQRTLDEFNALPEKVRKFAPVKNPRSTKELERIREWFPDAKELTKEFGLDTPTKKTIPTKTEPVKPGNTASPKPANKGDNTGTLDEDLQYANKIGWF